MKVQLRPIPMSGQWIVRYRHPEHGPTIDVFPDRESADEHAHALEGIPYQHNDAPQTPGKPTLSADDAIRQALDLLDVGATSRAREALADYLLAMVQNTKCELPTPF